MGVHRGEDSGWRGSQDDGRTMAGFMRTTLSPASSSDHACDFRTNDLDERPRIEAEDIPEKPDGNVRNLKHSLETRESR